MLKRLEIWKISSIFVNVGGSPVFRIKRWRYKVVTLKKGYCAPWAIKMFVRRLYCTSMLWDIRAELKQHTMAPVKSSWVATPTMCGIIGLLKIASLKEFLIYNLFSYTQPMGAWVWQLVLETVGKRKFVEVSSLGRRKQEGVVSKVLKRH